MRVYLPSTLPLLAEHWQAGAVGPPPLPAYAVTPALREWYAEGDLEELEYAAMTEAARASLRLLADDVTAPRRRVVVAADVADNAVAAAHTLGRERSAVRVDAAVPLAKVAAVHADAADAERDVAAAAAAVRAADAGDDDAAFTVDAAAGHELQWWATQEVPDLVRGV